MDYNSLLELLKKRRSIRKFKPEPIPDDYVDKIIEAARWAPSGANSQPWEFIIINRRELRDEIIKFIDTENKLLWTMEATREPELRFRTMPTDYIHAPVFIIVSGDPRTKDAYPLNTTTQRGNSVFISSLASAFLYMHLAATSLGLASQWITPISHYYVESLTKALLGVPKELELYEMMAVGYPDTEPRPRLVRAKEDMVHHDYYDKTRFRTEQRVKDFIACLRQS